MTENDTEEHEEERLDERVEDLHELMIRGQDYREDREFEYLGSRVEVSMKPMEDPVSIPLTAALHVKFDLSVEEARDEVEEAREDDGQLDMESLDDEFVDLMSRAARASIDYEACGWTAEQFYDIVGTPRDYTGSGEERGPGTMNGLIVELGMEGFELAGSVEDAKLFRGRGSQ